ncbi:chromate efflux transporter [Frigidibacter sp. RF13]|uniref:chromate efflux transporter n=1 Tax=Frigidibacter sp. RF13 TaxID=2997340 RepID=UPI00226E1555|nr:chromate efflux transporter [Frigidibacter sp. RF13]MCY1125511.1 chromate efflux transporter [Frigidibacter sp. RF13]
MIAAIAPGWGELWRTFGRIGLLSFGGPAGQIALMHRILVDEKRWLAEEDYLRALSFCMLLPGPEAMQLATYCGWRLRGLRGGLVAGLLFVLPGAAVIFLLAFLYALWAAVGPVAALFWGVKASVAAIVLEALMRVAKRALKGRTERAISVLAFVAVFAFALPFPLVLVAGGLFGTFALSATEAQAKAAGPITLAGVWRTLLPGALLWGGALAFLWAAGERFLFDIGLFFSKLALVTFGGAYAVLTYMAQAVVADKGWLTTAQMMDALGLAETTPGPLILVTQFVAVLAGYQEGGASLAVLAGLLCLWVTFLPCFLWIFAFAPQIEAITARPRLKGALAGISAAVVGTIASLTLWFALHVVFTEVGTWQAGPVSLPAPRPESFEIAAFALALASGWLLIRRHWPLPLVLLLSAVIGLLRHGFAAV